MKEAEDQDQLLERASSLALRLYADGISDGKAMSSEAPLDGLGAKAQEAIAQAEQELEKSSAKKAICAALGSGSDDLKEMTKMAGAALLPLLLTGAITLPVTPLALAAVGIVLFRMSVSSYCADVGSAGKPQK